MKHSPLKLSARSAFAAAALGITSIFGSAASAQTPGITPPAPIYYQGVGPAVAGTTSLGSLPRESCDFIDHHFHDAVVERVMQEYAEARGYEVSLADGTDIEFNAKGEWTEVDGGDGLTLPEHLLRDLLPDRARHTLEQRGVITAVETLKRSPKGYKVELRGVELDDYRFDSHGNLLSIND